MNLLHNFSFKIRNFTTSVQFGKYLPRKYLRILLSVVIVSATLYCQKTNHHFNNVVLKYSKRITTTRSNINNTTYEYEYSTTKYILDWTSFFGSPMNSERGWMKECPDYDCIMVSDKSMLRKSDAVVFHIRDTNWNELPQIRLPNQYYVFYLTESPAHSYVPKGADNFFNLTMTYRLDSDFFEPYGDFRKKLFQSEFQATLELNAIAEIVKQKTKMVAWFVSNCVANSKRELYVGKLQKYTRVDTFGNCSRRRCPPKMSCNDMLKYNYKFYLSFENSICKDYVTEKLYNRMNSFVIPVVLNKKSYENRLPPNSVISVSDFSNVKELADYLKYLDSNLTAYMEYFQWRKWYTVVEGCAHPRTCSFCGLCQFLHEKHKPTKIKTNIRRWWYTDGACDRSFMLKLLFNV